MDPDDATSAFVLARISTLLFSFPRVTTEDLSVSSVICRTIDGNEGLFFLADFFVALSLWTAGAVDSAPALLSLDSLLIGINEGPLLTDAVLKAASPLTMFSLDSLLIGCVNEGSLLLSDAVVTAASLLRMAEVAKDSSLIAITSVVMFKDMSMRDNDMSVSPLSSTRDEARLFVIKTPDLDLFLAGFMLDGGLERGGAPALRFLLACCC